MTSKGSELRKKTVMRRDANPRHDTTLARAGRKLTCACAVALLSESGGLLPWQIAPDERPVRIARGT